MGTPEFASVSLKALVQNGYSVESVVTTEDKPRGRGHKMTHPDVYITAEQLGIQKIYQPVNLKRENFEEILTKENPDLIAVVAYGKLLPEYVINYPKYGCINVHGSLLPKYRGAAPMQWCLIDGEKETGITTMYMDKGLDTGDMLLKESIPIGDDDNFGTVHDKLAVVGARLLCETIDKIADNTIVRIPQGDAQTHYAQMITREITKINWSNTAEKIFNLVRGLTPFPKASCIYNGKSLKILRTKVIADKSDSICGTIVGVNKDSFDVACANGTVLRIYEIQSEGKRAMPVEDFLKGNTIEKGTVLE